MTYTKLCTGILTILLLFNTFDSAQARVGGGRSSGSRGSRGFAPRPSQPPPSRPEHRQDPYEPRRDQEPPNRGSFTRGVLGGVAGGFLGSMLARNVGFGGDPGAGGGGGGGILWLLLLGGLGFVVYRKFFSAKSVPNDVNSYTHQPPPPREVTAIDFVEVLRRYDSYFNLTSFQEERMDDFLKIQSAWNMRDLTPIENLLAPEMRQTLQADVDELKRTQRINKLENIAVRGSDLTESWQENGKEYASLRFRAQLLDYTIDESTQSVVAGDRAQPVKFEEEWTFVRNHTEPVSSSNPWQLSAIAQ